MSLIPSFDPDFYVNYNSDLRSIDNAWKHWTNTGIFEHRMIAFDWKKYLDDNPDVKAHNNSKDFAVYHCATRGFTEKRKIVPISPRRKIKLLIMDILFPMVHGLWRTTEINWFLAHPDFDTDVFVSFYQDDWIRQFVGDDIVTTFKRYYALYPHLNNYYIRIFNPKYNVLNQFNKGFDGTIFNGLANGDFLLTKHLDIQWSQYDAGYCIFLSTRSINTNLINLKLWPTISKIYPGGGYTYNEQSMIPFFKAMQDNQETAIVSQEFIAQTVAKYISKIVKVYGVPLIAPNTSFKPKSFTPNKLDLCFTSIGFAPKKGFDRYLTLAQHFANNLTHLNIKFHVVGTKKSTFPTSPSNMNYHGVLTPDAVESLYLNTIDIIVAPLRVSGDPDGFPIGGEAMIHGCIPIICDPHNSNSYYQLPGLITPDFNLDQVTNFIVSLYSDINKRKSLSSAVSEKTQRLFSPDNQLIPVAQTITLDVIRFKTLHLVSNITIDFAGSLLMDKPIFMAESIFKHKFLRCVEIGVWRGRSLAPMIVSTAYLGGFTIGIDPYSADCMKETDAPNIVLEKLPSFIAATDFNTVYNSTVNYFSQSYNNFKIIRKPSNQAHTDIIFSIDLLHIDGNHDRSTVEQDINLYVPKVRSGGWIIMDDIGWDSVISKLPLLNNYATKIHDMGTWGVWQKK